MIYLPSQNNLKQNYKMNSEFNTPAPLTERCGGSLLIGGTAVEHVNYICALIMFHCHATSFQTGRIFDLCHYRGLGCWAMVMVSNNLTNRIDMFIRQKAVAIKDVDLHRFLGFGSPIEIPINETHLAILLSQFSKKKSA